MSLFQSRRRRKLYYLGKEDFYQSRNALNVSSAFNFHKDYSSQTNATEKEIKFYGLNFGKSEKEIKRVFGKPNFRQKSGLPLEKQLTLFYKLNIKGIKCILQMHLYNNQMFFAQIQLRDANTEIRGVFLELFKLKYKIESLGWNQIIKDHRGARIMLKDDIVPKASFFSSDSRIWNDINSEFKEKALNSEYSQYQIEKIALRWS
ncbi:hypothetical protein [Roseivirga sp.]|uniref:hypothetical protein n=1 Tax=Roseivirga sp. TaxID=1964215 RepID=UPI003B522342